MNSALGAEGRYWRRAGSGRTETFPNANCPFYIRGHNLVPVAERGSGNVFLYNTTSSVDPVLDRQAGSFQPVQPQFLP